MDRTYPWSDCPCADIRVDICKIKYVRVELSVQPCMSIANRADISNIHSAEIRSKIRLDIGVANMRARSLL